MGRLNRTVLIALTDVENPLSVDRTFGNYYLVLPLVAELIDLIGCS